jgi:hypothetical protein
MIRLSFPIDITLAQSSADSYQIGHQTTLAAKGGAESDASRWPGLVYHFSIL